MPVRLRAACYLPLARTRRAEFTDEHALLESVQKVLLGTTLLLGLAPLSRRVRIESS
jgi:hypothetical protein